MFAVQYDTHPRVKRNVTGFEPEQIFVSFFPNYDSVWISWITGEFQIGESIKNLDPNTVASVVQYGKLRFPKGHKAIGESLIYNQLYPFEGLWNYTTGIIQHVRLKGSLYFQMESEQVLDDDQVLERNVVCEDLEIGMAAEEPKTGMTFESKDLLHTFYKNYVKKIGFGVRVKGTKYNKGICYVTYGCSRGGQVHRTCSDPTKQQLTTKTNCPASITASSHADNLWVLIRIVIEHNHDLDVGKAKFLKCNRYIPANTKMAFELNAAAGIKTSKTVSACTISAQGFENLTWTERDARKHLARVRRTELQQGDAQAMLNYFRKMQTDNPRFFHTYEVDEENRLKSVFWANARSIAAYKEFGDAVTFDTTYLVNSYDMPFAPFVGVNHHGQSTLFGCSLITNEDNASFEWVFNSFLDCMGVPPTAIITDQDRAMKNAIAKVFPTARHRWCIWHILKKVPEKLGGYADYESFKPKLLSVVWDSLNTMEFEELWNNAIDTYNLHDNDWLAGLYAERSCWVPAFLTNTFWAGMSTTQRSESINAFFYGFVHRKTTLREFVAQYANALARRVQQEVEEDANSFNKSCTPVLPCGFERQFLEAYTNNKFIEFRNEIMAGCMVCHRTFLKEEDGTLIWKVREDIEVGEGDRIWLKEVHFHVHYNQQSRETTCTCRRFEFRGIVCRHITSVWSEMKLAYVPESYILRRWKKNIIRSHTQVKLSYAGWERKSEWQRYDTMMEKMYKVVEKAMLSDSMRDKVLAKLEEAQQELEECIPMACSFERHAEKPIEDVATPISDPTKAARKGKQQAGRRKSISEQIMKQAKAKTKRKAKASTKKHGPTETSHRSDEIALVSNFEDCRMMPIDVCTQESINFTVQASQPS